MRAMPCPHARAHTVPPSFLVDGPLDSMQLWLRAARYPFNRMVSLGGTAQVLIEKRLRTSKKYLRTRFFIRPERGYPAAEAENRRSQTST